MTEPTDTPPKLRPLRETIPGLASGYEVVFRTLAEASRKGLEEDAAKAAAEEKGDAEE